MTLGRAQKLIPKRRFSGRHTNSVLMWTSCFRRRLALLFRGTRAIRKTGYATPEACPRNSRGRELLIRRCFYHVADEVQEGFYITLYLFGYGDDEAASPPALGDCPEAGRKCHPPGVDNVGASVLARAGIIPLYLSRFPEGRARTPVLHRVHTAPRPFTLGAPDRQQQHAREKSPAAQTMPSECRQHAWAQWKAVRTRIQCAPNRPGEMSAPAGSAG